MFQAETFNPGAGPGFLPPVRLAGQPRPPFLGSSPGAGPGFLPPVRLAGQLRPPFPGPSLARAGRFLGLSLEEGRRYYERAKAAVAKFDQLVIRTSKIDYKPARDAIVEEYGLDEPANRDKARYMRDTLQAYVAEADLSTPPNYYVFIQETSRPRNRTDWVEDMDKDFSDDVKAAEQLYGTRPDPQVLTREVTVASSLAVPVLVGAAIVAIAVAFG